MASERFSRAVRRSAGVLMVLSAVTGCATTLNTGAPPAGTPVLAVAASINAWGSILSQLGGTRVRETSIITNPATDPHSYEPTPADARTIAESNLFVQNGIGYDPWAKQALAASPSPSRLVITVGTLVAIPDGSNPHRWYDPTNVDTVAAAITADLTRLDPTDATYFSHQLQAFETVDLAPYHHLISQIATTYSGTPVGASESIVSPLAGALGLNVLTPDSFLRAISEGSDPSAADKSRIDAQIAQRLIKIYVVNTQNSTPDVAAQVAACHKQKIPVVGVTETLSPAGATFQSWQVAQLQSILTALHQATRR